MIEERALSFEEDVEPSSFVQLDEGVYKFEYCGYSQGNTQPRDGGQSFPTAIVSMKARNVLTGEEMDVTETFTMSTKWQWKLSQFWKSLGSQEYQAPDGKMKVKQGWNSMIGKRGWFEVTRSVGKKAREDGTFPEYTNKTFLEPEKVDAAIEKYSKQNNPYQQPAQPAPQQTTPTWGKW